MILYCESSQLLATPLLTLLKDLPLTHLTERDKLWQTIQSAGPRLIVLGDSFCTNLNEAVFCMKSYKSLKRIPLILVGDNTPEAYLPIDFYFPRFGGNDKKLLAIIGKWLEKEQSSQQDFSDLPETPGTQQCYANIRHYLQQRIYTGYLKSQLEGIPIAGTTLENVMDTLMGRVMELTGCDFCYMEVRTPQDQHRRLYSNMLWPEEIRKDIFKYCKSKLPSDYQPVEEEWICAFPPSLNIPVQKEVIPGLNLNILLKGAEPVQGILMAGNLSGKQGTLSPALQNLIGTKCGQTLQLATQFREKEHETDNLYRAFTHFLPGTIIEDLLLKTSERDLMTGEKRKVVVLFSHIRNFEYITEHNEPENIVRFLNNHFSAMGSIIQQHGGTIDKFIGDAIFAIFGAPISYEDNSRRAVEAAIEMIDTYRKNELSYFQLPPDGFHIGVGLNEGEAIIGNIGCSVKFDYTAIGDTVNLAARLESLCKHYHRDILISEVLYNQVRNDFFCRLVDIARVKGKTEPSRIFALEVQPEKFPEEWRSLYQKGLTMYTMGNWYLAIRYLEKAVDLLPEDYPTRQFLERCEEFMIEQPENWNGAVTLNFK